jgi:hypothetical protein
LRGCGPFVHTDQRARPEHVYGGQATLYTGGDDESYVVLPVVPPKDVEGA